MNPRALAELAEGESARWSHVITAGDVDAFAELSGDVNPLHLDDDFARRYGFRGRVVHGMLLSSYLSRVLGTVLPGPGVLWLSQDTRFLQPAYVGDRIDIDVRIKHFSPALRTIVLDTTIGNHRGETLMTGEAKTMMLPQPAAVPWTDMVAVVTGSSRGIGAAVAQRLGARGAKVVVNYRSDADAADEVVRSIGASGGEAIAVQADVEREDDATRLGDAALEAFGRLDVVVSNATPPIERKPFEELTWSEVDRYWRAYVQSTFSLAQRAVPGMKERSFGRFVNILTSAVVGKPPPNVSGYVAAKSALWGLTRGMAVELAPFGITVNAISPSAVLTDQWAEESDRRRRSLAMSVPAQRLAGADEVAAAALFLIGEEGGYVTGTNMPVAGGEVM